MHYPTPKTAILFFSLSPEIQAQHKQWQGVNKTLARKTHSRLCRYALGIIEKSGLSIFHSNETNQKGVDFGSKLSNAVEGVFHEGYDSVIILGNDCPQLNSGILEIAVLEAHENRCVIGPSQRGGVYLMGFHRDTFDKSAFENLPWQTPFLQDTLLDYLNQNSEDAVMLPFRADLNLYQDLGFFSGLNDISSSLKLIFKALVQCLQYVPCRDSKLLPSFLVASSISHRGPPLSF